MFLLSLMFSSRPNVPFLWHSVSVSCSFLWCSFPLRASGVSERQLTTERRAYLGEAGSTVTIRRIPFDEDTWWLALVNEYSCQKDDNAHSTVTCRGRRKFDQWILRRKLRQFFEPIAIFGDTCTYTSQKESTWAFTSLRACHGGVPCHRLPTWCEQYYFLKRLHWLEWILRCYMLRSSSITSFLRLDFYFGALILNSLNVIVKESTLSSSSSRAVTRRRGVNILHCVDQNHIRSPTFILVLRSSFCQERDSELFDVRWRGANNYSTLLYDVNSVFLPWVGYYIEAV